MTRNLLAHGLHVHRHIVARSHALDPVGEGSREKLAVLTPFTRESRGTIDNLQLFVWVVAKPHLLDHQDSTRFAC